MGSCASTPSPTSARSKAIDSALKEEKYRMAREVKLLLLGAGESGKSTILKQMRLIHAHDFTDDERETFRGVVFDNVMMSMRNILEAMDVLGIPLQYDHHAQLVPLFRDVPAIERGKPYPAHLLEPIKALWNDQGVQAAYGHGSSYALDDNANIFFNQVDRLFMAGYTPTDDDIIRSRVKTTGIAETVFKEGALTYRMFDVGGQRSERKKWIHCFENVTAVLFTVAISGYDACLVEDKDSNQMHEALMLFDSICNSQWFRATSMILFLNKIDVFSRKILTSPVSKYFTDFVGDDKSLNDTKVYFRNRFERLNKNPGKVVYTHYTDATDTKLLRHVMNAVNDTILRENIQSLLL
ncbi:guanine nucleotide binding protein, alpha subunit [Umbelopsis sp. AD052]|nr:guanine nucleotide binding protein, alpha subunit [Umbelopsis sp. AD052]